MMNYQQSIWSGFIRLSKGQGCIALAQLKKWIQTLRTWRQNQRTRYYLSDMPEHLLKDIGLTESDRQEEIKKHFWQ